ncbi:MAG: CAP domain-containing protein [Candidatus Thiodiazotropha endolucinida]|nr:CAP domain-containing protein [Candidatus Thiodiazotropha taylori]MCG8055408.1 CAP domain-containing protein [Candidatus Thiodiazotropha taylori]MCW4314095.1 CAP domain-containing protein [Candidatus Thiodiazotropha taylori]MCW4317236.1 CAP domain-containing protein [Candidatus Thiodiazotropha taylori]
MLLKNNTKALLLSLLLSLTLVACGGGGSGGDDEGSQTTIDDNTQDDSSGGDDSSTPPQETGDDTTNPDQGDNNPVETEQPPPADDVVTPQPVNQPPSASISGSQNITSGETVTLDGSASSDPDGDSLSYLWTQTAGEALNLTNNSNPSLSFIAPEVTQSSNLSLRLTVNDGEYSAAANITLQLSPATDSTAPTVTSRSPLADAVGVSTTTQVSVSFDEPLDATLIDNQSLLVTQAGSLVAASVSYDSDSDSLILSFDSALLAETLYRVTLGSNLQDPSGNPVPPESWDFTTGSSYNLGNTSQATIDACMDESDKLMLTLVNNARAVSRDCGGTQYGAVEAIAWQCQLETAAQNHSTSMADNDFFDHTGLDGSSPGDRITAAGYNWRAYAENIAAGYNDEEAVMTAWLESPGHCANIMNTSVTEIGAGMAENASARYRIYWTQDFADQ